MQRGEIWWANLDAPTGHRPVLLLSRSEAYHFRDYVLVAPLTTRIRNIPAEVNMGADDGVPKPCVINLDVIYTIAKIRLQEKLTTLKPEKMLQVEKAIHFSLSLED